jgi:hypothetical protein
MNHEADIFTVLRTVTFRGTLERGLYPSFHGPSRMSARGWLRNKSLLDMRRRRRDARAIAIRIKRQDCEPRISAERKNA